MKIGNLVRSNLLKNAAIILFALICYPLLKQSIIDISLSDINNILLFISIMLVTVCFANFAFTYEKVNVKSAASLWLAHITTFVFMLLMALLLETMMLAIKTVYPNLFNLTLLFSILMYLGIILYDMWDLLRAQLSE